MSLALSPPVTSDSAPVTIAAASEARKTAAGEMSSGCSQPTLSGTVGARLSEACCGVGCSTFCPCSPMDSLRRFFVAGERGVDEAGDQSIHRDVVFTEFDRR